MPVDRTQISRVFSGNPEVHRALVSIADHIDVIERTTGISLAKGRTQNGAALPAPPASWSVTGANGVFSAQIEPAATTGTAPPVQYQLRSSSDAGFVGNLRSVTLGVGQLAYETANPNAQRYWAIRWRAPGSNWSGWQSLPGGAVNSGKLSGSAITQVPTRSIPSNGFIGGQSAAAIVLGSVTGMQRNMCPNSDLQYGGALWKPKSGDSALVLVPGGGLNGGNAWSYTGTGAATATEFSEMVQPIPAQPGAEYTLSMGIDATSVTNDGPSGLGAYCAVVTLNDGATIFTLTQAMGSASRIDGSFVMPAGDSQVAVICAVAQGAVVASGKRVTFVAPQLEIGGLMTAYKPNVLQDVPPNQPSIVSAVQAPYIQDGVAQVKLTVTYQAPSPLGSFAGVLLGIEGYHGDANTETIDNVHLYSGAAGGQASFVTTLDRTGEAVTIFLASVDGQGINEPWIDAPTLGITLNGQLGIPSTPTGLTATPKPSGNLLTWNKNPEANISGYQVWRNTVDNFATATVIANPSTVLAGNPTYMDPTDAIGLAYWYWVQAVDTAGNASNAEGLSAACQSISGVGKNAVPDSGLKYPAAYWPGAAIANGAAPNGGNALKLVGSVEYSGSKFAVTPGNTYTFSCCLNATALTAGYAAADVTYDGGYDGIELQAQHGVNGGRQSMTFTVPAGKTTAWVYAGNFGTPAGTSYASCFQVEAGPVMTAYKESIVDDLTGKLLHTALSAQVQQVITAGAEIESSTIITGRAEGIGVTVQQLNQDGLLINADQIAGDGVTYGRIKIAGLASGIPYTLRGVWSSATAYVQGDEVVFGPTYWIAVAANTNSQPTTSNGNWQVIGSYAQLQGAWSSATSYAAGAEVTYGGNYWVCVTANTNSQPSLSNANWQISGPTNLDQIVDGPTYAKVRGAQMQDGIVPVAYGKNCVPNPSFESAQNGFAVQTAPTAASTAGVGAVGASLVDSWTLFENNCGGEAYVEMFATNTYQRTGAGNLLLRVPTNLAVPVNAFLFCGAMTPRVPVKAGDSVYWGGWSRWDATAALPAGATLTVKYQLRILKAAGGEYVYSQGSSPPGANAGYALGATTTVVPADGVSAAVEPLFLLQTNSSTSFNTGSTLYGDCRFDDVFLLHAVDLSAEVVNQLDIANHAEVVQNRTGIVWSVAGQMPYVDSTGKLQIPSIVIAFRPQAGDFCRLQVQSLAVAAWDAIYFPWVANGNATIAAIAYTDPNYGTTLQNPANEILGTINADSGQNIFCSSFLNTEHFSAMQQAITIEGYCVQIGDPAGQSLIASGPGQLGIYDPNGGALVARHIKRAVKTAAYSQANGAEANDGTVVYFNSVDGTPYLLDAGGAAFPSFGTTPVITLTPLIVNTADSPQQFYAGNVTTKSFEVVSKGAATVTYQNYTFTNPNIPSGGSTSGSTTATQVCEQVAVRVDVETVADFRDNQPTKPVESGTWLGTVTVKDNTTTVGTGTISITWSSTGRTYSGSVTIPSLDIPAGDTITITVTDGGGGSGDVSSVQADGATLALSGAASVNGVDFNALIVESWA